MMSGAAAEITGENPKDDTIYLAFMEKEHFSMCYFKANCIIERSCCKDPFYPLLAHKEDQMRIMRYKAGLISIAKTDTYEYIYPVSIVERPVYFNDKASSIEYLNF